VRIELTQGDITTFAADAIVNAANHSLLGGGGVDGAIHRRGGPEILAECRRLRETRYPDGLPTGESVATTAGELPARWVIHTVGPVFGKRTDKSPQLRSCYTTSLAVADELGARTVAFPLISAGVYRWPKDDAVRQALRALRSAETAVELATLVLFDETTHDIAQRICQEQEGHTSW
jgi:O-acetyl-ADP-ribose deacetylase (regulator of RNase III)